MTLTYLLFAEDPGAALFMRELPAALRDAGAIPVTLALPFAAPYFPTEKLIAAPDALDDAAAEALLARFNPAAVIFGTSENPDSFAFNLVAASRRNGVPTIAAVDSAPNAEHRFRGHGTDPLRYAPDTLLVADSASADAYRALGIESDQIAICGHPRFDEIAAIRERWSEDQRAQQRRRHFPGVPDDEKIVVFVSELSVGLGDNPFRRDDDYSLAGTSGSDARSRIVGEELLLALSHLPYPVHRVLRLHPKQDDAEEADFSALFDQVSQSEPGLELVNAADLVVGMTSILLIEAACLGRPVLSIVPRSEERQWLGDARKAIPSVSTRDAIDAFLTGGDERQGWPVAATPAGLGNATANMVGRILSDCQR
ncbi:hypothetical protein [Sphingopyxis sp. C-1]|uniref:hypothetical protein n=1 Tax=Sphingopyxis sp. C-1 TaxID=262667 RepID=UPI0006C3FEE6|nr:hypothetical protein [Sphingopyxis sp. C-1]GAO78934.1 hypothetical protein SC1_02247 [Sphingopyxis sp. C-1]